MTDNEALTKQKLMTLLKELPENERLILALSFYENLSFVDIGEVLNKPVKEVTKLYTKILEKLRDELHTA